MASTEETTHRPAKSQGSSGGVGNKGGRKSASLPTETVDYLKAWMMSPEHIAHPYPTEQEKAQIMAETGIELKQLTNWFVNNRKRYWKPRVEAKLQHKYAANTNAANTDSTTATTTVAATTAPESSLSPQTKSLATHQGLTISLDMTEQQQQPTALPAQAAFPVLPQPLPTFQQAQQAPPSPSLQPQYNAALGDLSAQQHQLNPYIEAEDPHTISEGSGSSACNSSDDDSVDANSLNASRPSVQPNGGAILRREEVDVHILRPESTSRVDLGDLPTIRDLTIKGSVPKDRVLATFPKCQISYTVPFEIEHDRKKVQSRRDGEVLRVKKHYLKLYLATRGIHSVSSPIGENNGEELTLPTSWSVTLPSLWSPTCVATVGLQSKDAPDEVSKVVDPSSPVKGTDTDNPHANAAAPATAAPKASRVRSITCTDLDNESEAESSRKRARTSSGNMNGEEWREACLNARSLFCESLPGLEDAARMFGYNHSSLST